MLCNGRMCHVAIGRPMVSHLFADRLAAASDPALLPGKRKHSGPWPQLCAAWLTFVVSAGIIHVPATLLGGVCRNASLPCSLAEEFPDESGAALGWLPSLFLLIKGLIAIPAGQAMARYGVRSCLLAGTVLLCLTTAAYACATSFWMLPAIYLAFGLSYSLSGLIPLVVFANSWFDAQRKATAIGLLVTGFAVSGMMWPAIAAAVAERYGWRTAAALLPCTSLVVALPLAACILRDGPHGRPLPSRTQDALSSNIELWGDDLRGPSSRTSDSSGCGDGTSSSSACRPSDATDESMDDASASSHRRSQCVLFDAAWARDPAVWYLLGMNFLSLYIVNAMQHMLVTYLCTEVGLSLSTAGLYFSLIFALSLAGKVIWGIALDRPHQRLYALAGCALLTIGSALLVRPVWVDAAEGAGGVNGHRMELRPAQGHVQMVAFACTFGLGYGGTFTLVQSRAAQLHGARADFPKLQSCLGVAQYVGSFLGVLLTSQLRELDEKHSFTWPFALLTPLGVLNLVLCTRVFRPAARSAQRQRSMETGPF